MDKLAQEGLIRTGTRRDLLKNSLVMIADPSTKAVTGRDEMRKLVAAASVVAVGNPDSVPAGSYAVEALKKYGLYEIAQPKLALGGTVREVLQHVQNGSAPLGIVFLTDALSAQPPGSVVRIFRFPAETFSAPIVYPVAVTTASKNRAIAEKLIEFLRSDVARRVFVKAGFEVP
jgi:molybdate transport system substrate-binding protein